MFAGFNLPIDRNGFEKLIRNDMMSFEEYRLQGEMQLKLDKLNCKVALEEYVINGVSDGTKIESDWFPQLNADVFISHSHKDEDLVMALAGWLNKKFKLTCFIDSCVWGYANDLLENINSKYSNKRDDGNGGVLYNHTKCNIAASHVHMMLCMALQKMIDKTEAVIVVNTENSIKKYEDVYDKSTFSPWIYAEIVCTQTVRNRELSEYRKGEKLMHFSEHAEINNSYQAAYKVSLDHLKDIDTNELDEWLHNWCNVSNKKSRYSLDELYKITHPEKVKALINVHNSVLLG